MPAASCRREPDDEHGLRLERLQQHVRRRRRHRRPDHRVHCRPPVVLRDGRRRLVIHNASGRVFYRYGDGPKSSSLAVIDGDPSHRRPATTLQYCSDADTGRLGNRDQPHGARSAPRSRVLHNVDTHSTTIIDALSILNVLATVLAPQNSAGRSRSTRRLTRLPDARRRRDSDNRFERPARRSSYRPARKRELRSSTRRLMSRTWRARVLIPVWR